MITARGLSLASPPAQATEVRDVERPRGVRPKVLFIGDSITESTTEIFTGYARIIKNARPDWDIAVVFASTAEKLQSLIQENLDEYGQYDVIYVNVGLHSIRVDRFEDKDTFRKNLSAAADLLKGLEKPKVIWRTTTPIAEGASGGRDYLLVPAYNDIAKEIMQARGIAIDDMYAYLMPYYQEDPTKGGKYLNKDGTHWSTASQINLLVPRVVQTVLNALEN